MVFFLHLPPCAPVFGYQSAGAAHLLLVSLPSQPPCEVRQCCHPHGTDGEMKHRETKSVAQRSHRKPGIAQGIESRSVPSILIVRSSFLCKVLRDLSE